MITVLMRDQHRIDAIRVLADRLQPLSDFLAAQSCIDEQPHLIAFNEGRIPPTSTSEHRYGHSHRWHYARSRGQDRGIRGNGTQEAQEAQERETFSFLCLLCFLCSVLRSLSDKN